MATSATSDQFSGSQTPPSNPLVGATSESLDARPATGSLGSRFWKIVTTNKKATFGFGLFLLFVLAAIIGPFVAPYDPTALATGLPSQGPSPEHWLGTTRLGQDIFSQLLVGTRTRSRSVWQWAC